MASRISVVFLTRSLEAGGAEVQLASLASGLPRDQFAVTILCFYEIGELLGPLKDDGIRVIGLKKKGRWDLLSFFIRLVAQLRRLRPDIVHAFLGPPNILAALAKPFLPKTRIVWGIRASNMELNQYDFTWRVAFRIERLLSSYADLIATNSVAGRDHLQRHGFHDRRTTVVPNGIDPARFVVAPEVRVAVRAEWGVTDGEYLIGIVARLDPMKDHENFLRAAALLAVEQPLARFICIGADGLSDRLELQQLTDELGIGDRVVWTGYREDMVATMSALDIHTSASAFGEGFSNAVAESMAAGVPNVVTDVGDTAHIVGATGEVVPPQDPASLADGWRALLSLDEKQRLRRRAACIARIADNFSRLRMIGRMAELYHGLSGKDAL